MNVTKAILITYPTEESINEALSLAEAAGYKVEKIVKQKHITKSKYGIGKGKAQEVNDMLKELKINVIIFDEVLKPIANLFVKQTKSAYLREAFKPINSNFKFSDDFWKTEHLLAQRWKCWSRDH
jgi:hypothetical protein